MFSWLNSERKQQRKKIEHALFEIKYARRMREDLLDAQRVTRMRALQHDLKAHLKAKRFVEGAALADNAIDLANEVHPAPGNAYGLRENIEVFVVVIAVALAFRTYFFQPYQIPTGSMQPTLYGITAQVDVEKTWADRPPFRWAKFLLTGTRYMEIRAKRGGIMPGRETWLDLDTFKVIQIGSHHYKIHQDLIFEKLPVHILHDPGQVRADFPKPGQAIRKGDLIASGLQKQGDHIIVNRFITNFRTPRRGDITVFATTGLPLVRSNSAYIKRLTGLPGEMIQVCEGRLWVDGQIVDTPEVFERQAENERYSGYANVALFADCTESITLSEHEYLMMGDNTYHSLDGRFFGAVPGENILGIGFFVPWPFANRGIYGDSAGFVR
jgi:signal peptidase I